MQRWCCILCTCLPSVPARAHTTLVFVQAETSSSCCHCWTATLGCVCDHQVFHCPARPSPWARIGTRDLKLQADTVCNAGKTQLEPILRAVWHLPPHGRDSMDSAIPHSKVVGCTMNGVNDLRLPPEAISPCARPTSSLLPGPQHVAAGWWGLLGSCRPVSSRQPKKAVHTHFCMQASAAVNGICVQCSSAQLLGCPAAQHLMRLDIHQLQGPVGPASPISAMLVHEGVNLLPCTRKWPVHP